MEKCPSRDSKNCVFCKIANEEFDSAKIWENEEFLAILDINPNTKGMTLVIPKKHHHSYVFDMKDKEYENFMLAVKKVVNILEKGLGIDRVAMVMEGMGVDHAHIKLYPMHGVGKEFNEVLAKEKVYFDKYPGYITTQMGETKNLEELKKLAEEIKSKV